MSDLPKRIWLDKGFQPWRVWPMEMEDLPEYVLAGTSTELTASEFVAGLMTDDNVRRFLSQRICCDGQDCGCQGADIGSYLEWIARPLPQEAGQ